MSDSDDSDYDLSPIKMKEIQLAMLPGNILRIIEEPLEGWFLGQAEHDADKLMRINQLVKKATEE